MRHHPSLKGSCSLCQGLESWGFIQFMPQGVKHSEIWSRKRNKDIPGKRQPWGQAAAALRDAGWGRMGEQGSASNRQPEQSSRLQWHTAAPHLQIHPQNLPGALIGSAGGPWQGLGVVWELGPSPGSGERKEVVGRGGAAGLGATGGAEQLQGVLVGLP